MINVILGKKGSGKTKKIIELANQSVSNRKGDIVFIDNNSRYMYDLNHEIRFINAGEFKIGKWEAFYGFLCGIVAEDYDVDLIFVDGFLKIIETPLEQMEDFFNELNALSEKLNIRIIISVSADPENVPVFLHRYLMN